MTDEAVTFDNLMHVIEVMLSLGILLFTVLVARGVHRQVERAAAPEKKTPPPT